MQRNIKKQYKSNIIVVNNINNNHTSSLEKTILSNGIIKTSKDEKIMEKSTKSDKALLNRNLEEYIMTDLNSLDYEDALIRDKRDYLHFVKKYQRYQKHHHNIPAHCSPAFKRITEGDIATIGQCRPLSKTVRFNVIHVQGNRIFGSAKKLFMLF